MIKFTKSIINFINPVTKITDPINPKIPKVTYNIV